MESTTPRKRAPKTPSNALWYAFITCKKTNEALVMGKKTQTELRSTLRELDPNLEVQFIVKGKGFKPVVQKSYDFIDDSGMGLLKKQMDISELIPEITN